MPRPIPLIILGGADRKPARLPEGTRDHHPLSGCKGVDVRLHGRCLIEEVRDRLDRSRAFDPIWIAGPRATYLEAGVEGRVVDTNGSFGDNIRAGIEAVGSELGERPMAIVTCDA
ncbi:MAG: hypothetical protein R3344_15895, partial [Acidobacteriota bacterium]|nr:hypothetical protein [Acidobacteriota bacterium]